MSVDYKRKLGEKLEIAMNIYPAPTVAEPKYVRAFLFDEDMVALTPAFVNLVDKGNGKFLDRTIVMPNKKIVYARLEVFLDSAYTQVDEFQTGATDVYEFDSGVLENIQSTVNDIESGAAGGAPLVGEIVEGETIIGQIVDC